MKKSAMVLGLLVLSALGLSSCNANGTSTGTATSNGTTSASGATTSTATTTSTGGGPGGGGSSSSASYGAVNSLTSGNQEFTGSLASTSSDQSVVLVNGSGAKGWLEACTVSKSGDTSSADNSSFYGQNATLLAKTGNLYVNGGTINSTGEGGAGIAAYSSSGIAYSKGVSITTTSNAAGVFTSAAAASTTLGTIRLRPPASIRLRSAATVAAEPCESSAATTKPPARVRLPFTALPTSRLAMPA